MSGHSKWSTIKRKKGKIDAQRGKIFTKIAKEIMVAVKEGGSDPDGNFRLKLCIQKAKENNMPNDNINRAIQKAAGSGADADKFEEFIYEGYGAGGIAILVEIMSDNRNRTASEIRHLFSKNNGNMGETGCVGWMFERKGRILLDMTDQNEDEVMLAVLEAGAEDMSVEDEEAEIIMVPEILQEVREKLINDGFVIKTAEIAQIPENTVEVTDEKQAGSILNLVEALEDNEDVQNVYSNFDISDELMENLS